MKVNLPFCIFVVQQINAFNPEKFDYCKIHCIFKEPHSACKCIGPNPIVTEGIDKFRTTILKMINNYRSGTAAHVDKTVPPAANMMVLKYNIELEHIAKCYAKKIKTKVMEPDLCRRKHDRGSVGQTYYWTQNDSVFTLEEMEVHYGRYHNEWHDQMKYYKGDKREIVESYEEGEGINFYAQINWAETTEVGCIRARSVQPVYRFFIICNFAKSGCVMMKPIYLIGEACTKCPENSKCKKGSEYPLLCYPQPPKVVTTTTKKPLSLPNVTMGDDTFPLMFRDVKPTPNGSDLIDRIFFDINTSESNQEINLVLLSIVTCFIVFFH